jgi:hypothetical protein
MEGDGGGPGRGGARYFGGRTKSSKQKNITTFNDSKASASAAAADEASSSPVHKKSKKQDLVSTAAALTKHTALFERGATDSDVPENELVDVKEPGLGSHIATHANLREWFSMLDKSKLKYQDLDPSASKILIRLILTKRSDKGKPLKAASEHDEQSPSKDSTMDLEAFSNTQASSRGSQTSATDSSVYSQEFLGITLTTAVAEVCDELGIGCMPITRVLCHFLHSGGEILSSYSLLPNAIIKASGQTRVPMMRDGGSKFSRAHLIEALAYVTSRLEGRLTLKDGPLHVDYNMVVAHLKGNVRTHPLFQGDDTLDVCPPVVFHKNTVTHFMSVYGGIGWGKVSKSLH